MKFSASNLHWLLWLIGSLFGVWMLLRAQKISEKMIFIDKSKRGIFYWLKRIILQIVLTGTCIALFLFSPISCTKQPDRDCQTATDNRGVYLECE